MAIRGKVKDVKIDPMGRTMSGTVLDTANKIEYQFEQPFGEELGLAPNSIVQFETVRVGDQTIGVSLDPVDKATIETIDFSSGTGTIKDKSGAIYEFTQNYCKELGLDRGMAVKFAPVTYDGKMKATALKASDK